MTQVKTDILLNGMRLEIHPSKLTKCGEIHINDDCTNVFLFCAFCSDEDDPDVKIFRTLPEFIDHIRWHRSDDLQYPLSPMSPKEATKCLFEAMDDDSRSNLSAPRHETDDISDWIAPPEELFELNTIGNFIEMDSPTDTVETQEAIKETMLTKPDENVNTVPFNKVERKSDPVTTLEVEEDAPEISGEVFIELLDLFKKCPCVWHIKTEASTNSKVIQAVYDLLASHYNKCAQQTKSTDYVRQIITEIKTCFLEEYKDVEFATNDSLDCLPWYFPYLSFLLDNDSEQLDKSVFTDYLCPICTSELTSQEDLWDHLYKMHLQFENGGTESEEDSDDQHLVHRIKKPTLIHFPKIILEKFIEIYRSQARLWDKNNDEYYSRELRRQSYEMLLRILRQHDSEATHSDVISKINCLRNQFASERQRVISSKNNTNATRSWYYDKMKFLIGHISKKPPPPVKARPANFKKKVSKAKCPICSTIFTDHSVWLSHMQSAHTSDDYKSEDGFFYCTICGWQNKTKELLMRHLRNRHTHNLQKCTDCNLGFRLLSMLVEHRAKIHNDFLPFKCEICTEAFATRSRLRSHSTTHWSADDLPYKCEHCGAKFFDRNACNVHVRRHNVAKKFRCEICEETMTTMASLRQHLRTHMDICPHICDSCGKAFHSAALLITHLNEVHGGVTFPCNRCEKEFQTEKALMDHARGHLIEHNCDACGAKFLRKNSLRKHKRLKHEQISYDYLL